MISKSEIQRLTTCFSPVLGVALGFLVGWGLHFYVPANDIADALARFIGLVFGIAGWAIGLVLGQQKKLHCGGSQDLDLDSSRRYIPLALVAIVFFIFAPIFLVKNQLPLCFLTIFLFLVALVGEIGWGRPAKILDWLD